MGYTSKKLTLEQREITLARVEELMVKGIQRGSEVARIINCSLPTANSYIRAIQTRWRVSGSIDLGQIRSELLEKSKELESGYWEIVKNGDNSSAKVGALNGILEVQKHQAFLAGIKKVMESQ